MLTLGPDNMYEFLFWKAESALNRRRQHRLIAWFGSLDAMFGHARGGVHSLLDDA
jgi:hypothetical protein